MTYALFSSLKVLWAKKTFKRGRNIFLFNLIAFVILPGMSIAQSQISGTVKDNNGTPMSNVSVLIKGTSKGTTTDASGNYSISAEPKNVLIYSYTGFTSQEIPVKGQISINVVLQLESSRLADVVVVGYGTQKRSDITGSVSSVPKDRLSKQPVTNVLQAIQGSVAGVNISSSNAAPGSVASIYIRGLNSISASTAPLIVLDGLPFSGSWNDININDIASIEILKDASATAIYGTRGSNGVILITTKTGTNSKPLISYNGYVGTEYITHFLKPMDGAQYVQKNLTYNQQAGRNPDPVPNLSEVPNYNAGKTTDWIKEVSQSSLIQNHELSIRGGNEFAKYFVSGSYLKERGNLKGYLYNTVNLRSNIDLKITDWLKGGVNLFYVNRNDNGPHLSLALATEMSPYGQEYNADGTYNVFPMNPETLYPNPLVELYNTRVNQSKNVSGNFYAEVQPAFLKGLKYRINYGASYLPSLYEYYTSRASGDLLGTAIVQNSSNTNWILENILSYEKEWGLSKVNVTALYSAQKNTNEAYNSSNNGFINDQSLFYNLGSAQQQQTTSSQIIYTLVSQMVRINYGFNEKYLVTATARRDGYSGFGLSNKYGLFPSIALGWNISNENFMKDISAVSSMKIRASYGTTGNQSVSPYQTLSTLGIRNYVYGPTTAIGLTANRLGNSDLKWESTSTLNLGVDFGLLANRINGTIEVYQSKTDNLLLARQIPSISGFTSILDNIGATQNKGIEATIRTRNIVGSVFSWSSNINFSLNRNKITRLYGDNKDDIGNKWFIGKSLRAVYDYVAQGIWQTGEDASKVDPSAKPGDIKFEDLSGDGKITSADRMYLGTSLPSWIGGLTNTFNYKNLSLNIFIQTFQGSLKNNPSLDWKDQAGRINLPSGIGYWTSENKNDSRPALTYINSRSYGFPKKNSYTRIKDITLSYNVPVSLLEKYKIANLSLYVSGRNLLTFTNWYGWDPELDRSVGEAANSANYPNIGTVVFGLSIGLK